MKALPEICQKLHEHLIVSCQAPEGDVFHGPDAMARFAVAARQGGAGGIRANGVADIAAIRRAVRLPIIGIQKTPFPEGGWLITGSFEAARALVAAGADIIALDCSRRGQELGALDRVRRIRSELGVPVMADIATLDEALAAEQAGADLVATTLRGYTADTGAIRTFDPGFVRTLVEELETPVVTEGRVHTPEQAREALLAGAFAVVVGTAITAPREIARRFACLMEIEREQNTKNRHFLAIDLGGTNTKSGIVSREGELLHTATSPTPPGGGRQVLLDHLKAVARQCMVTARQKGISPSALGIATAGWVDCYAGRVAYATDNLPGWTGTPIAEELEKATGLPVAVENDANALALAEKQFGVGRSVQDFVCLTLGTGVGGGCIIRGSLNRGPHFFANALGHITLVPDGHPCTCGKRGCLEAYANAAALLRFAQGSFKTAEEVIAAGQAGDAVAAEAIRILAGHLAAGTASIIQILDPEMVILSGGIVENNPLLLRHFQGELQFRVSVWEHRKIQVQVSRLGYFSGVLGAVAAVLEKIERDTRARFQFTMQSPTSFVPGRGKEGTGNESAGRQL
jgi:predicted NBD/HSP70 family sugar kinase/putative N-acetylmannosamine-6-phosphate epimerase